jgi:hypothetical protein
MKEELSRPAHETRSEKFSDLGYDSVSRELDNISVRRK